MALVDPIIWKIQSDVSTANGGVDLDTLTMLPNGGYVVTWRDSQRIAFQLYDGNGEKVGPNQFVPQGGAQQFSDIQPIGLDGEFAITWTENTGTSSSARDIKSQKYSFDGNPIGSVVTLPTTTSVNDGAQMSANNLGWVTTYVEKVGSTNFVKLAQYDAIGNPSWITSIASGGSPVLPDVAWIGGANHAVTYINQGTVNIFVAGVSVSTALTISGMIEADVVGLKAANGAPTGEFVVVTNSGNGSTSKIEARKYHFDGTNIVADGSPVTISSGQKPSAGDSKVSVTALRGGGFAVAYVEATPNVDTGDIWVRVFDADGTPGNPIKVHNDTGQQLTPSISEMADGRLAVSWHNPSLSDGRSSVISTSIVDARAAAVTVVGTSHNDIYAPSKHAGDDLDGGAGFDTLTFKGASSGVAVDLVAGNGSAGDAAGDTYKNFEKVIGTNFNDTLTGGAGHVLVGGAGNDIYGVSASDTVIDESGGGYDQVYASASYVLSAGIEDLIATGTDAINLTGNASNNTVLGNEADNQLQGLGGNDVLRGNGGNDTLYGGDGEDDLGGGDGNDILDGGEGNDLLQGGAGHDALVGGNGSDSLHGGEGSDTLDGGNGDDWMNGGVGADVMSGGAGNDSLYGAEDNDNLDGGAGNDVLDGGIGDDALVGGDGNDALYGADGSDNLNGGYGNDFLEGGAGNDALDGGNGDDWMNGGAGADVMIGGDGNDTYIIDDVNDVIYDTSGVDTVYLYVDYDVSKLGAIENITGAGSAPITFTGNAANNTLSGNDGANILYGGAGRDVLHGGAGNDRIHGQSGRDVLYGDAGRDIFVFDTKITKKNYRQHKDTIADFSHADDSIYLENRVFKALGKKGSLAHPKKLAKGYFHVGTKAHDANDHIIYNKKTGALYYDPDGTGYKAQVLIATLSKHPKINYHDFFVI